MLSHRSLNTLGSSALVVLGIGHLVTSQMTPQSAALDRVVGAMRGFAIVMPGRTGDMFQYYQGFSLMMGILLLAYGVLALLAFRGRAVDRVKERPVLVFNALVSAVALVVSAQYFFAVPLVLTAVALVAYCAALAVTWRQPQTARRSN
jgi:hypothetical protein